jgi:hypothetical protein
MMIMRTNGKPQMTPRLRKLILAGAVIVIAFGVTDVAMGHVAGGVLFVGIGSITSVAVLSTTRQAGAKAITSFQMIKAYSFFGVCALGGVALFVLAVAGVVREPVLLGALGLITASGSLYVIIGSRYPRGR